MLERFAEEDRLEQMGQQASWGGRVSLCRAGPAARRRLPTNPKPPLPHNALLCLQRRRARQAEHTREVERLLAYRRQLYMAMRVGGSEWVWGALRMALLLPLDTGLNASLRTLA